MVLFWRLVGDILTSYIFCFGCKLFPSQLFLCVFSLFKVYPEVPWSPINCATRISLCPSHRLHSNSLATWSADPRCWVYLISRSNLGLSSITNLKIYEKPCHLVSVILMMIIHCKRHLACTYRLAVNDNGNGIIVQGHIWLFFVVNFTMCWFEQNNCLWNLLTHTDEIPPIAWMTEDIHTYIHTYIVVT